MIVQGPRRDGEWDVKMEMNMPGMPANMPARTTKQCITPAEAGESVYTDDGYTGTVIMDLKGRGEMTMKYTGKRIGGCTK